MQRKKVTAGFVGRSISSNGGLNLVVRGGNAASHSRDAGRLHPGTAGTGVGGPHAPHGRSGSACSQSPAVYEDADDCDVLRRRFAVQAGGRPGADERPQSLSATDHEPENTPSRIEVAHMTATLVDISCHPFVALPAAIRFNIDDTCDAVHGYPQLSLFLAEYDTRCFLSVHVYHVESGRPLAVVSAPREGRRPGSRIPAAAAPPNAARIQRNRFCS